MIKVSSPVVGAEELAAVQSAFDLGYFGQGSKVMEFENALGAYLGANQVVAVNTGTAALHLALLALGIGPGDEVLVPSLTFVACFQMIAATGARPVPCEVYPDTLLLDLEDAAGKITANTKALMPVHYAGNPGNLDKVYQLAKQQGLRVIEDAAHALGSTYNGQLIGSFGEMVCFSFDSIKNITCGEGGAVVCADPNLAEKIRQMRLLGIVREGHADPGQMRRWFYGVKQPGFRYHMSNINAAIGLAQLAKLPGFIARRQQIARRYDEALAAMAGLELLRVDYTTVAPHIYVVRVKGGKRDALMEFLREHDIEASINYIPNHWHEHFRQLYKNNQSPLPVTEKVFAEILTLPLHCGLSDLEVDKVIAVINSFY
jgi:perosamine synthetase